MRGNSSAENKLIRIAKCDVFSGACEINFIFARIPVRIIIRRVHGNGSVILSACRATVGLYSCTVAWLHVRNCQHKLILYLANQILLIANQLAILAQKCESS